GAGQIIEIASTKGVEFDVVPMLNRIENPPRGRSHGMSGALGLIGLKSGTTLRGKGRQVVPVGDRLVVEASGGGGYGAPFDRASGLVASDLLAGLVSGEAAERDYGVVFTPGGTLDHRATAARRRTQGDPP